MKKDLVIQKEGLSLVFNRTKMKKEILDFVTRKTNWETMNDVTTKQVASSFNIETSKAYSILNELSKEKKITKLDPVNSDNFSCCGWINNES